MEFCSVVLILYYFKPMYPFEYRDMDTGNTGDYHAPHRANQPVAARESILVAELAADLLILVSAI